MTVHVPKRPSSVRINYGRRHVVLLLKYISCIDMIEFNNL